MSQKITKLSKLFQAESFVQVDLVKGYKYIDKAGEIVNKYYDEAAPVFSMGLNGLVIKQPLESIEELKIAPEIVWAKFNKPDSLEQIVDTYSKETEGILEIIEVEDVNRIGWRNYFIHDFTKPEDSDRYFEGLSTFSNGGVKLSQLLYTLPASGDLEARVAIKGVTKADETNTKAVLFDVDVYKDQGSKAADITRVLKLIAEYLRSDFVDFLNSTFERVE